MGKRKSVPVARREEHEQDSTQVLVARAGPCTQNAPQMECEVAPAIVPTLNSETGILEQSDLPNAITLNRFAQWSCVDAIERQFTAAARRKRYQQHQSKKRKTNAQQTTVNVNTGVVEYVPAISWNKVRAIRFLGSYSLTVYNEDEMHWLRQASSQSPNIIRHQEWDELSGQSDEESTPATQHKDRRGYKTSTSGLNTPLSAFRPRLSSTSKNDGTQKCLLFVSQKIMNGVGIDCIHSETELSNVEDKAIRALSIAGWIAFRCTYRNQQLYLDLSLTTKAFRKGSAENAEDLNRPPLSKHLLDLLRALNLISSNESSSNNTTVGADARFFYSTVRRTLNDKEVEELALSEADRDRIKRHLRPTLRPYQEKSVAWMLHRERLQTPLISANHPLWHKVELPRQDDLTLVEHENSEASSSFYINIYTGLLSITAYSFRESVRGGVLADEMGLGKTVEFLALVSASPFDEMIKTEPLDISATSSAADSESEPEHCIVCSTLSSTNSKNRKEPARIPDLSFGILSESLGSNNPVSEETSKSQPTDTVDEHSWIQCDECHRWCHENCAELPEGGLERMSTLPWLCKYCVDDYRRNRLVPSRATILVVPATLLQQWQDELSKHLAAVPKPSGTGLEILGDLKVSIFEGVKADGFVSAHDIANSDVVLTTYNALQADIYRAAAIEAERERPSRRRRQYQIIPTPLLRIRWRRICMDEAQMVESTNSQPSEMIRKMTSDRIWCITGTPIRHSALEMYGMMCVLNYPLYSDRYWFQQSLKAPAEANNPNVISWFAKIIRSLVWRFNKQDVKEQLGIPDQMSLSCRLRFGPIERAFYRREYEDCKADAALMLSRMGQQQNSRTSIVSRQGDTVGLSSDRPPASTDSLAPEDTNHVELLDLGGEVAIKFLARLLELRKACCHPQLLLWSPKVYLEARKTNTYLTTEQVLAGLIKKTKVECEEALRLFLTSSNGLAALYLLENPLRIADAIKLYRESLSLVDSNQRVFRIDKPQQIHIFHNYHLLLQKKASFMEQHQQVRIPQGPELWDGANSKIAEIVQVKKELGELGHTLKESKLQDELKEAESAYLLEPTLLLETTKADLEKCVDEFFHVDDLTLFWWIEAIRLISLDTDVADALVNKLKTELVSQYEAGSKMASLAHKFFDIAGLRFVLEMEQKALFEARTKMVSALKTLPGYDLKPSWDQVQRSGNCWKCRFQADEDLRTGPICMHCMNEDVFKEYERHLFHVREKRVQRISLKGSGSRFKADEYDDPAWKSAGARGEKAIAYGGEGGVRLQSEWERILRMIPSFLRRVDLERRSHVQSREEVLAAFPQWVKMTDLLKEEFKLGHVLFSKEKEFLGAKDEIEMAKLQVMLRSPEEVVQPHERLFKILKHEVGPYVAMWQNERRESMSQLARKKGQLLYLETLERNTKANDDPAGESEKTNQEQIADELFPKSCPVCYGDMDNGEMSIFPCGHAFCLDCPGRLFENAIRKHILCPTCRTRLSVEEISLISTKAQGARDSVYVDESDPDLVNEQSIPVEGSYGTKISAIVRRMKSLLRENPDVKILLFSQWTEMLKIIESALIRNDIGCCLAKQSGRAFVHSIETFKSDPSISVLMMSVNSGANGLNLIEASHIILVEPFINPALEAQAKGRIHRMGQQKKTFVHHFVIHESIESKIHDLSLKKKGNDAYLPENVIVDAVTAKYGLKDTVTCADVKEMFEM